MAKSKNAPAAKTAAAPATEEVKSETTATATATAEAKVPLAKMRGPRGVAETAKITILTANGQNPKRPNSKAFAAFACYKNNMTTGEFCDAVNAIGQQGMGTPNLVYDASHGFIKIEGYNPDVIAAKPAKEPKAPKEPKAKKEKAPSKVAEVAAADAEATEETMD